MRAVPPCAPRLVRPCASRLRVWRARQAVKPSRSELGCDNSVRRAGCAWPPAPAPRPRALVLLSAQRPATAALPPVGCLAPSCSRAFLLRKQQGAFLFGPPNWSKIERENLDRVGRDSELNCQPKPRILILFNWQKRHFSHARGDGHRAPRRDQPTRRTGAGSAPPFCGRIASFALLSSARRRLLGPHPRPPGESLPVPCRRGRKACQVQARRGWAAPGGAALAQGAKLWQVWHLLAAMGTNRTGRGGGWAVAPAAATTYS